MEFTGRKRLNRAQAPKTLRSLTRKTDAPEELACSDNSETICDQAMWWVSLWLLAGAVFKVQGVRS